MISLNTEDEIREILICELTAWHSSLEARQFLNLLNIELLTFIHLKYDVVLWRNNNKVKINSWMLFPKAFGRLDVDAFTFYKPNEIYYQQNYELFTTSDLIKNLNPLTVEQTIQKLEELYDRTKHES